MQSCIRQHWRAVHNDHLANPFLRYTIEADGHAPAGTLPCLRALRRMTVLVVCRAANVICVTSENTLIEC